MIDVACFLCDACFSFLYFRTSVQELPISRARKVAALLLLSATYVLYFRNISGVVQGFSPIFFHSCFRLVVRTALYTAHLMTASGTRFWSALYGATFFTAIYSVVHNAFFTPITYPFLHGEISIFVSPVTNTMFCILVVCGCRSICYSAICRVIPLSGISRVTPAQVLILLPFIITSLALKALQFPITNIESIPFSLCLICLQAALLLCLVLFERYQRNLRENTAWRFQAVTAQSLLKTLRLRRERDETVRRLRHDLKNHMLTLRHLIQSGYDANALAYIDNFLGQAGQGELRFRTGSALLDALLSEKLSPAAQSGVEVSVVLDFRRGGFLDDFTLCVLAGNALDNAVESCAKVPRDAPRFLEVRGGPSANQLLFQVSNSCAGAVPMAGPLPRTTKADREHHGFGLSSIARALEPYGGTLTVTPGEDRFTLTIAIPMPEEASPCTKSQFVTTNPSSGTPF